MQAIRLGEITRLAGRRSKKGFVYIANGQQLCCQLSNAAFGLSVWQQDGEAKAFDSTFTINELIYLRTMAYFIYLRFFCR